MFFVSILTKISSAPILAAGAVALGLGQGVLYAPASIKPLPYGSSRDAGIVGPFGNGLGQATKGYKLAVARVSRLFRFRRPSHISRLIISVVVNSINRVFGAWRAPNILKKEPKALSPSGVHRDAPTAIAWIARHFGVVAPTDYVSPGPVLLSVLDRAARLVKVRRGNYFIKWPLGLDSILKRGEGNAGFPRPLTRCQRLPVKNVYLRVSSGPEVNSFFPHASNITSFGSKTKAFTEHAYGR